MGDMTYIEAKLETYVDTHTVEGASGGERQNVVSEKLPKNGEEQRKNGEEQRKKPSDSTGRPPQGSIEQVRQSKPPSRNTTEGSVVIEKTVTRPHNDQKKSKQKKDRRTTSGFVNAIVNKLNSGSRGKSTKRNQRESFETPSNKQMHMGELSNIEGELKVTNRPLEDRASTPTGN
jgi:hypothetical protein